MVKPIRIKRTEEFGERWRQWTQIVRWFALQNARRFDVAPDAYGELHAGMLAECRVMAARTESPQAARFHELEEILAPWKSLDSLELADQGLLRQLLCCCLLAQRMFGGRFALRADWLRAGILLLAAGLLAGLLALLLCSGSGRLPFSSELLELRREGRRAWDAVAHNDEQRRMLLGGFTALLATVAIVWRSARRS